MLYRYLPQFNKVELPRLKLPDGNLIVLDGSLCRFSTNMETRVSLHSLVNEYGISIPSKICHSPQRCDVTCSIPNRTGEEILKALARDYSFPYSNGFLEFGNFEANLLIEDPWATILLWRQGPALLKEIHFGGWEFLPGSHSGFSIHSDERIVKFGTHAQMWTLRCLSELLPVFLGLLQLSLGIIRENPLEEEFFNRCTSG